MNGELHNFHENPILDWQDGTVITHTLNSEVHALDTVTQEAS